ncbi:hypothetical protein UK23_41115 [Lentzea aerocolonigenes]|uniref:Uncharacterized protein n=1 Tax=Lentzea aerocolonigenes TaxID=68170 RepID=A0A0F0GE63_LENAE|nr:hypothetical protein UK23_41115 [Lentzea aerocolonigenes]
MLIGTLAAMTLVNVGSASAAGGDWLQGIYPNAGPPTNWRHVADIRRVTVVVCRDNSRWDECTSRDYYP